MAIYAFEKEHAMAVGVLQMSTADIRGVNKGIGVENMHHLNDGLWKVRGGGGRGCVERAGFVERVEWRGRVERAGGVERVGGEGGCRGWVQRVGAEGGWRGWMERVDEEVRGEGGWRGCVGGWVVR